MKHNPRLATMPINDRKPVNIAADEQQMKGQKKN
jgi:hypothetical protein